MVRRRRDSATLDLFGGAKPVATVVSRYDDDRVRADSLRGMLSRAVAETLRTDMPRADIASRMSEFLGEAVSIASLNCYASQARDDQSISAVRLLALVHATGDARPLQLLAEQVGRAVVDRSYLPAIEEALLTERIEELTEARHAARQKWKAPR